MRDDGIGSIRRHVNDCLERIDRFEDRIRGFVTFDRSAVLSQVEGRADWFRNRPLAGITLGVKDIIDALPYPTECGTRFRRSTQPVQDAAVVARLKSAGAVVFGKTVTTEFAYFAPGPTRNPFDLNRTPGGSSSGSAAAVAAGFIDVGLGSQTAASITRPASYCGVVGFKPTHGRYSLAGVRGLAPSFDTLGFLCRDVPTAAQVHSVIMAADRVAEPKAPARVGVCRTPWWDMAEAATQDALLKSAVLLSAGAEVEEVGLDDFVDGVRLQAEIMAFEAAAMISPDGDVLERDLSPVLMKMIELGREMDYAHYQKSLRDAAELRRRIDTVFETYDVLAAPAAPGEAPEGLASTGDPIFSRLWSLLGLPTITVPGFTGPSGMPVGIQLLARAGQDEALLSHALWAEQLLPAPKRWTSVGMEVSDA